MRPARWYARQELHLRCCPLGSGFTDRRDTSDSRLAHFVTVLPAGFAPAPRPHLGLTDHKSAVLLLHHGRCFWHCAGRDGCCPRYLPLDRRPSLLFLFASHFVLPGMDSHHRHPVPETGVLLLNYPASCRSRQELHLRPQGPQPCVLSTELREHAPATAALILSSGRDLHPRQLDVAQPCCYYTTAGARSGATKGTRTPLSPLPRACIAVYALAAL